MTDEQKREISEWYESLTPEQKTDAEVLDSISEVFKHYGM